MRPSATNESEARQGWLYLGKISLCVFGILVCLVTVKLLTEHKLAPRHFGLGGVLSQPRVDLLLMGSSHTRKSYDMRLLEKETGVASEFQISYDGTDLSTMAQMLDYLAATPEHCPRFLVVEAYSAFLGREPDLRDPRYFSDAPPPLKAAILRSYLAQRDYRSASLDIFDLVVNRGNDEIVSYPLYLPIVEHGSYKGGRTDNFFPGLSPERFRRLTLPIDSGVPDPVQLAGLYHILDLAQSHHIAVIFIDTPMPHPVTVNPNIQSLKKDFSEILGARHIPYIDGDRGFPVDDPTLFSDNNHISTKGRVEFTLRISRELTAWMASQPADR